MSDTSPSEYARIAELSGNDPYRQEVLVKLTILMERSKRGDEWMEKHDAKDERRFADVYAKIDEKVGVVTSSVNAEKASSSITLKQAGIGILIMASTLGAWAIAIWGALKKP
jgi:hypothetical protein